MGGKLTGFTVDNYEQALKSLLPKGPAWESEQADVISAVLYLTARELQRIDLDIAKLIDESDPRTASATLSQWYKEWGIPDECLKSLGSTTSEQWRKILVTKIRSLGLTYSELLVVIARVSGMKSASAQRVEPFTTASRTNQRLYGRSWDHAVLIISATTDQIQYFRTSSRTDERLAQWGNALFECLVRETSPAHKVLVFSYTED